MRSRAFPTITAYFCWGLNLLWISVTFQVLQALRRLKGSSTNKKEKMSAETKVIFDQLTEDAMRLMENGDYS